MIECINILLQKPQAPLNYSLSISAQCIASCEESLTFHLHRPKKPKTFVGVVNHVFDRKGSKIYDFSPHERVARELQSSNKEKPVFLSCCFTKRRKSRKTSGTRVHNNCTVREIIIIYFGIKLLNQGEQWQSF